MTEPSLPSPRPALVIGLMALISVVWGTTWLVIRTGLDDLPPLLAAGVRFVIAGSVMAALVPWLGPREGGEKPPRGVVVAQALCQFTGNFALVYWCETVIPSGLVSVLWATFPLMMALTGHFVTRAERLHGVQWLGLVVAFAGVASLFGTDVAKGGSRAVAMGLLLLLAPASVMVSTTLIKRRASNASSLLLNRDSMLLGGVLLLVLSALFERGAPVRVTQGAVLSVAYLALFGSVITFGAYLWLLRAIPAYRLSLVSYITPVIALFVGRTLGNEPFGATTLFGAALVLAGVALTLQRAKPA
ncbi:MAG TPA: EamA family transporter [Polyangiaceae bacterium]|jgi:drug/metabolite transporter (DMT)-like permease|nr:EamA family transporter [Polyangiaceae bacterium]